jgi:uncharacterized protein YkwD
MNPPPYTHMLGLICAFALASCASPDAPDSTRASTSPTPDGNSASNQVFASVNSYRVSQGKQPVQRHAGLDRLALLHSEYLQKNRGSFGLYGSDVSHMGFDGRSVIARQRYQMVGVSENVAAAKHPGKAVGHVMVQIWKRSHDHHKNMLDSWTHSGVGVVVNPDGTVFATQIFSVMSSSHMTSQNRFKRH